MKDIIIPMDNPQKLKPTYDQVKVIIPPIDALLDNVLVIHIAEPEKLSESKIIITEDVRQKMLQSENMLVKAIVKSVGPNTRERVMEPCVAVNDIVYVWPGGFESKIVIDNIEYLVYGERDLKARVNGK